MVNLSAPIALHNCGEVFLHACSPSKVIGRAPVLPLATGRFCTPFGHINARKQLAPSSRHVLHIRSMVSDTDLKPQSKDGGSAWLGSSAMLASGGALPGLLLAWKWEQVGAYVVTLSRCIRCSKGAAAVTYKTESVKGLCRLLIWEVYTKAYL